MSCRLSLLLAALFLTACSTTGVERGGRTDQTDTGSTGGDTATSDTTAEDTSGGSADTSADTSTDTTVDTSTEPGQPGDPCTQNSDCASSACLSSGGTDRRCAAPCATADSCVAGWDCLPLGGAGTFCQCTASTESCNGGDDDCDLLIDEGTDDELGCTGLEQCNAGACSCDGALLYCGSLCTDLNSDPANCGDCGIACPTGFACNAGTCACDLPSIVCGGACANLDTDTANCGDCGIACAATLSCIEGLCTCAPGQQNCGGTCADTDTDPDNCGGCGIACGPTQTCDAGICTCPTGFSDCRGECRNLSTDPDNCGLCGAVCTDIQACSDGACTCPDGGELCNGRCTITGTDPSNCGTCGNSCATGGLCNAGSCACPGRQTDCGGDCTDTRIDDANCGTCGTTCSGLETCSGGACSCPATATQCGADCTDIQTDANNCGGCGTVCAAGTDCINGLCGCPCGGNSCDLGTCFVMPFGSPVQATSANMLPALNKLDVAISMDTTGSMSTPISAVQGALNSTLGTAISALGISTAFGVSAFDDFPCSPYGTAGTDIPFRLLQRQTTDFATAQAAAARLALHSGGDTPESGLEALFQIATGGGRALTTCSGGTGTYSVATFNSATGRVAGVADGALGGMGFRSGALPLVVHITDALSSARGEVAYPYGATRTEALNAMRNLGGRIASIAVDSGFGAAAGLNAELSTFATQTEAVVPACAWDFARPTGCAAGQCCTGNNRTGVAATAGRCPLAYRATSPTSSAVSTILLDAAERMQNNARFNTAIAVRRDEAEFLRSGIDTSCLATYAAPNLTSSAGTCDPTPATANLVTNGYDGAHTGDELGFDFELNNSCIRSTGTLRAYVVYFDLIGPNNTVLDTLSLSVAVP